MPDDVQSPRPTRTRKRPRAGASTPGRSEGAPDDSLSARLKPFLDHNPEANCADEDGRQVIQRPWGDPTVELRIPDDPERLVDALNNVRLPPRFTALWHRDSRDLEVIWTPLPVDTEVRGRAFVFEFEGDALQCEFGSSSDRLLAIAEAARPVQPETTTSHRNLKDFNFYTHYQSVPPDTRTAKMLAPTSFWVRGVECNDVWVADLARHMNFYMHYFDRRTPRILVHDDEEEEAPGFSVRYPLGPFPASLRSHRIDANLLRIWESTVTGDPFLRFLYNYQILEYAGFYFVQDSVLQAIKNVLVSPDAVARPDEAAARVLEAMAEDRLDDNAKMLAVMRKYVDPSAVWSSVEPHAEYFCQEIHFDGGLVVPALLNPGWGLEDFKTAWDPKVADSLRRIRNAIVHARESRMTGVIAPTRANGARLVPWLGPVSMVAMQVMMRHGV